MGYSQSRILRLFCKNERNFYFVEVRLCHIFSFAVFSHITMVFALHVTNTYLNKARQKPKLHTSATKLIFYVNYFPNTLFCNLSLLLKSKLFLYLKGCFSKYLSLSYYEQKWKKFILLANLLWPSRCMCYILCDQGSLFCIIMQESC